MYFVYIFVLFASNTSVFLAQPWKKKLLSKLPAVFWVTQVFSENFNSVRIGLSVIAVYIYFLLLSLFVLTFLNTVANNVVM